MGDYKKTTVVFPIVDGRILLGMKKRGFGQGWWNGFGGKLDEGEAYTAGAVRETSEEVNVHIQESDLTHVADLIFRFNDVVNIVCKAYIATRFDGEPAETDEMKPEWFDLSDIPYDAMWPADDQWIPDVLDSRIQLPRGYIIDFVDDNQFSALKVVDTTEIKEYF